MGPVVWLRRHSGELYFFLYNAAIVFILPYFAIMWHEQGLTGGEIGILSAIRPFTCSISGQLLVGLADARHWHLAIAVITYVATLAARSSMALVTGFAANLVLILISEACQSPFSIISDAAIAASTDEAGYGRKRVLASLGWGVLAPLSGWIVGKYGVPVSIAVYCAICTVALVPTALLPLRELCRRTGRSSADEVPTASKASPGKAEAAVLGKSSASRALLPGGSNSSQDTAADLDSPQHNGQVAELAIELLEAVRPQPEGGAAAAAAAAQAAQSVSSELVDRLNSKLSQASHARQQGGFETPIVSLPPLLTTADEDAAEQEVTTARAAAAEPGAAVAAASSLTEEGSWTIPAVSPLRTQRSALPPIACPHMAVPCAAIESSPRPGSYSTPASFWAAAGGTLARTTSAATTAFYSVRSDSSMSNVQSLASPRTAGSGRGEGPTPGPRSALLAQLGGGSLAGASLYTPRTATSAAAAVGSGQPPLPPLPPGGLFRQTSEATSLAASTTYSTPRTATSAAAAGLPPLPRAQSASLGRQPSNLSQQQHGFSVPEGVPASPPELPLTLPAMTAQQQAATPLQQAPLATQLSNLSQTLHGFDMDAILELEGSPVGAGSRIKAELAAALASSPVAADLSHLISDASHADTDAPPPVAASGSSGTAAQRLSVWDGIKRLLSNPHHAAFFATTLLCGIGYGALGYENLYLKQSGAPGILLGLCQLASTCGEVPVFATSGWWLPKLGHELAFAIGMIGWIARLSLYTLLPLFPSPWCVLPVELLQGLTFAVSYGVGTVHAKAIAPPHLRSTTQSVFFGLYYGVGPGVSGLAGGYIYEAMGMRYVFIISASTLAVGWLCILLALRRATRAERAERAAAAELAP